MPANFQKEHLNFITEGNITLLLLLSTGVHMCVCKTCVGISELYERMNCF